MWRGGGHQRWNERKDRGDFEHVYDLKKASRREFDYAFQFCAKKCHC